MNSVVIAAARLTSIGKSLTLNTGSRWMHVLRLLVGAHTDFRVTSPDFLTVAG
jgi:hypothetical protein